jgi:hypothetical protein
MGRAPDFVESIQANTAGVLELSCDLTRNRKTMNPRDCLADVDAIIRRCYENLESVDVTKLDEEKQQRYNRHSNALRRCRAILEALPADCSESEAETALERIGQIEDLKEWNL